MNPQARLNDLAQGYQHAVVLLTAVKTGVFAALGKRTRTARALARELGFDARALETVLLALAADGLLIAGRDGFRIHPAFAPHLLPDSPETQSSILSHNYNCMLRWVQLEQVLRTGKPARDERPRGPSDLRAFICGMENISRTSSREVAGKIGLSRFRRMLDVGGGPATSSIVFARKNSRLKCTVFDLPPVIRIAREQIEKAGLADRVETRAGDYFRDEFGNGFDMVYVSNIIHSLPPKETLMLFRKCRRALVGGGTIIVKEFFLDESRTSPNQAALFSVNMLTGTTGGKSYTWDETQGLLERAGFGGFRRVSVAVASGLLIARRG